MVVCYTHLRVVNTRLMRLYALKEGFNVKNGNSLKVFRGRYGTVSLKRMR